MKEHVLGDTRFVTRMERTLVREQLVGKYGHQRKVTAHALTLVLDGEFVMLGEHS